MNDIRDMSWDQILGYLEMWSDEFKESAPKELDGPTIEELRLFNLANGIPRVRVPKQ